MAVWSQVKVCGRKLSLRPIDCTSAVWDMNSSTAAAVDYAACGAMQVFFAFAFAWKQLWEGKRTASERRGKLKVVYQVVCPCAQPLIVICSPFETSTSTYGVTLGQFHCFWSHIISGTLYFHISLDPLLVTWTVLPSPEYISVTSGLGASAI